jgi:hypothetical protein
MMGIYDDLIAEGVKADKLQLGKLMKAEKTEQDLEDEKLAAARLSGAIEALDKVMENIPSCIESMTRKVVDRLKSEYQEVNDVLHLPDLR